MSEENIPEKDAREEDTASAEVIDLPALASSGPAPKKSSQFESTGKKIHDSRYCFEVVRMLLDGKSYLEIVEMLRYVYQFSVNEVTLVGFKRRFYPYYRDFIDRVDKARHQHLVARITEEMKEAAQQAVHEVFELDSLLVVVEERIQLLRSLPTNRHTAAFEGVLNSYVRTKADLLKRMSEVTGSSGIEEAKKEVVRKTALAAQKTLLAYLIPDKKVEALMLFEQELEEILLSIEPNPDRLPVKAKR